MDPDILERIVDGREKPTNLPFPLLKNITEDFSEDRVIGQGGFAIVYKGVLPNGNVAVKRIRNNHSIDDKLFYREVDSLLIVSHQNIVRFLGFCASTDQTAIKIEGSRHHIYAEIRERMLCFEYISNGNLQKYITDELRGLEWNTRYQIIRGICEGLHHLHKEKYIYHMDLKPDNILLDQYMVPKITDFGLSRLDQKSRTMSEDRFGSRGYCAPEYLHSGKMSFKSDIYSLGIIITQLVTGDKGIPDNNKNNVLRRWRHRWKKTGKETPLVYQQVAKCMEIGLLCQEIDPSKRPFIWDLIHDIREMEGVDGTISNSYEYTLGQIGPYSEDDMLGAEPLKLHFSFELNKKISSSLKLTNQTDAYIAFNIQKMSPLPYCTEPNKGIVPPRSKCSVDVTLHPQDKEPLDMQRSDEFIVWSIKANDGLAAEDITMNMFSRESGVVDAMNLDVVFDREDSTKVSKELIPHSSTEDMSNNEADCTVADMKISQECVLPTALWMSSTGCQNHQAAAKESGEPQQAIVETCEMEAHEELRPDMQCTDELLVLNTIASKDLAPQSGEIFINKTDGEVVDEVKSDESLSPTPTLSESIIGNQHYQEGAQAFTEPQSANDTTTETEVIPCSSMLLDVHPLELCFCFEPNKLIACSLDLTNNTDELVAFGLLKSDEQTCFIGSLPMYGIVDPRTTYTLVLMMKKHENVPQERNFDLILQSSVYYEIYEKSMWEYLQYVEELGNIVHRVTLKGICAQIGEMKFESIPSSIKIITSMDANLPVARDVIVSMDANQEEQLIITGSWKGHVHIWNYVTKKSMGSVDLPKINLALSVKFIARKGWFLVGSGDRFIYVYNYKKEMQKITSFRVGYESAYSLAIHPIHPYVLSTSYGEIKLWDWEHGWFGWKCMQTYKDYLDRVPAAAFNPEDYNSFVIGGSDNKIKVWSLDSPKSMYTLSGHRDSVTCLNFFTRGDGQQYLISGSLDWTAKIWDMQKKECVCTLPHETSVDCVLVHPNLPVLITGTSNDGNVYLWSSTNFRLERIINMQGLPQVTRDMCLIEFGRLVVPHKEGVLVIEIRGEEEQAVSEGNDKDFHIIRRLRNILRAEDREYFAKQFAWESARSISRE